MTEIQVKTCFICNNMGIDNTASTKMYGYNLCKDHYIHLTDIEHEGDSYGIIPWKEALKYLLNKNEKTIELSVNFIIILKGNLKDLPKSFYDTLLKHNLIKKYEKYL